MEFRQISNELNKTLTKEERKQEGIFFTPKSGRDRLFEVLKQHNVKAHNILEPSFGSGEFLYDCSKHYPNADLTGVEMNKTIFDAVGCIPRAELHNMDFITYEGRHDLIIGNPPYFVIKTQNNIMTGRPNIYITFLYKCLTEHLVRDGHLAFIIPTSLYNCSYYQKMRDYIMENTTILHVETLEKMKFYETGQQTMLIVLKKTGQRNPLGSFIFRDKYISPYYKELNAMPHMTLHQLGFRVKTGNILWHNCKDKITDDNSFSPLIYSSNLKKSVLKLDNLCGKRKQYINTDKPHLSGKSILIERGYGNTFSFDVVLVDMEKYYVENHVNVIYGDGDFDRVLRSLRDERTLRFVKMFCGNGTLSASDLMNVLPIW